MKTEIESRNFKLSVTYQLEKHLFMYKGRIISKGLSSEIFPIKFIIPQLQKCSYNAEYEEGFSPIEVILPNAEGLLYDFGSKSEDDSYSILNEEKFKEERILQILNFCEKTNNKSFVVLPSINRKKLEKQKILEHVSRYIKDLQT
jgi:hypothetical protein